MLDRITPLILTRDEEANLERTLRQLAWAKDVVVVDSLSTDATVEIARRFPNVRVFERAIDSLAGQSNFGLQQVQTEWVLLLDADYFVPDAFAGELRAIEPPPNVRAYRAAFTYAVDGRPLRASLYPPRIVLLHREHARVWQDGHAHRVLADGDVANLSTRIIHDDRKPFARFLERQRRYMREEAAKLRTADPRALGLSGRIRKLIVVAPFAVLFHTLFVKGLILDGRAGLWYAWERFVAELLLSRELIRRQKAEGRRQN
ncbi:MAG TPA: glycosyltransferase family 2 protein [Thermoanaerobaculia bacterium]|nr:glycosyltransferase family 2 protein [Thermoanaerobaculia bacterium]